MRSPITCARVVLALLAAALPAVPLFAQGEPAPSVRRLSMDDAVRLALEQNLGLQVERMNPQIQDMAVAQAQSSWVPNVSSSLTNNSTNNPSTSLFSGGLDRITDASVAAELALTQRLPTGASYSVAWGNSRATSTNIFNTFDPLLRSNVTFSAIQPLLRNFKIDAARQQLETSRKDREASDLQLRSTIVLTTRNVKNAYWDLATHIANLRAQRESLDLA